MARRKMNNQKKNIIASQFEIYNIQSAEDNRDLLKDLLVTTTSNIHH